MRLTRASTAATMPDPVGAIVAFDATKRMFTVIADKKLLDGVEKGGSLDYEGKQLTVLELCKTVNDARVMCDEKKAALNEAMVNDEIGIAKIVFDQNGDAVSEETYTGESTPTINDVDSIDGTAIEDSVDMPFGNTAIESVDTIKDVLQNLMDDMADDVYRINRRYQEIREVMVKFFGTAPDGSIVNTFEKEHPQYLKLGSKAVVGRSIMERRYLEEPMEFSYFDKIAEVQTQKRTANKRRFESDDDDSEYSSAKPAAKKPAPAVPGQVGRAPAQMTYPFISRETETQIFKSSGGSASNYAQRICKLLFADSLQEYFKDQDPRKRDWIHEAVDFRFPSEDKCAQILKWKNCSNSINKNMKEAEKNESNKKTKDRNINYRYLNKEYEESCYAKANGDAGKYAELLSFRLFAKTMDKYFKEQDQTKKDWIRECVDIRYPIADAEKRTSRWKVCAAACNKNRTKVIGADGEENPYPFIAKEVEEDCFKKCQGIPYIYAELMARQLFPDTQQFYFKEQDLGRRNWLHMTLDKRFPTPDKVAQISKWKSCTSAINKNKDLPADTSVNFDILENNENDSEDDIEEPPVKPASTASSRSRTTLKDDNKVEESDAASVQSMSSLKRSRRSHAVEAAEPSVSSPPTISPSTSNTVTRSKTRTPKKGTFSADAYSSYPYLSEEDEIECLEAAKGNPQIYARSVGKILFRDSIKLYYKDQDPSRRTWMKEIVDFRFPTPDANDQKQKWKNVTAAINKNMSLR